jgi:Asp-tRNA(Asn)/Glu-tRNA(Gln) amidotransferase A subunit family amidase
MTRTVRDSALLLNALAKPDARDFMSLPGEPTDYAAELERFDVKKMRIGFLADMKAGLPVDPQVAAAAHAAAKALSGAGARVEEMTSFLTPELLDGMARFFEARSYSDFVQLPAEKQAKVLPFIAEWCTWRAKAFSGRDVFTAYSTYVALREKTIAATQAYDFVLSPTSPILPYEAELACPGNDPHNALPHIAFTVPYNMSEQPAASLNWTFSADGLPIGIQVIGRRFDDLGVLRLASLLEKMRPPQKAWPALDA